MPPAVAIAGAAVVGGATSLIAGNKAANAAKDASAAQVAEAQRQYDQTRADYAPYREVGYNALGKLASMYGVGPAGGAASGAPPDGGFTASPGYQFRLDQGVQAAERSAAARGSLASGGTMKAIQRYGEGLAASEYDNYVSRLAQLAGVGQAATGSTTQAGQTASQTISNALGNAGAARASSYANTGSAINGTANNLAALYLYNRGGGFGAGNVNAYGVTSPTGNIY